MSALRLLRLSRGVRARPAARAFSTVLDDRAVISPTVPRTPPPPSASESNAHAAVLRDALAATAPRNTWTKAEIAAVYHTPLLELVFSAASVHRRFHDPAAIQMCTLMSIKTGGCSEDCAYCAQSSRYATGLQATKLSPVDEVLAAARVAKENGSTRFCMGAAWRDMRGRKSGLRNIKAMVEGVHALGLESCVTLGMIDGAQARELKAAGLTAYNHNVDTSREFYPRVITTRSYDERLATLRHAADAELSVCSGGILGLGERPEDHVGLLHTVATLPAHPESFPVNALVPIPGTPLGDRAPIAFDALLRTVATARVVMPETIVRLAAGRTALSDEQQGMAFLAGANAVFTGEKMLTTECNGWEQDRKLFAKWGVGAMKSFEQKGMRERRRRELAAKGADVEGVRVEEAAPEVASA